MQISYLSLPLAWVEQFLFNIELTLASVPQFGNLPTGPPIPNAKRLKTMFQTCFKHTLFNPPIVLGVLQWSLGKRKTVQLAFVWTIAGSTLSHVRPRTAIRFLELTTLLMLSLVPSISVRWTSAAVTIKLKWTKLLSSIQPSPRHRVCTSNLCPTFRVV